MNSFFKKWTNEKSSCHVELKLFKELIGVVGDVPKKTFNDLKEKRNDVDCNNSDARRGRVSTCGCVCLLGMSWLDCVVCSSLSLVCSRLLSVAVYLALTGLTHLTHTHSPHSLHLTHFTSAHLALLTPPHSPPHSPAHSPPSPSLTHHSPHSPLTLLTSLTTHLTLTTFTTSLTSPFDHISLAHLGHTHLSCVCSRVCQQQPELSLVCAAAASSCVSSNYDLRLQPCRSSVLSS